MAIVLSFVVVEGIEVVKCVDNEVMCCDLTFREVLWSIVMFHDVGIVLVMHPGKSGKHCRRKRKFCKETSSSSLLLRFLNVDCWRHVGAPGRIISDATVCAGRAARIFSLQLHVSCSPSTLGSHVPRCTFSDFGAVDEGDNILTMVIHRKRCKLRRRRHCCRTE